MTESMEMYIIYKTPVGYVVRKWVKNQELIFKEISRALAPTLEEARAMIPRDLTCVSRYEDDEDTLLESWA